jgi:hypothetical protein
LMTRNEGGEKVSRLSIGLLWLALFGFQSGTIAGQPRLEVSLGPEETVMDGAIFPYMFLSRNGTLVVQGTLPRPPGTPLPEPSDFGGIPHTVRSTDGGKTWQSWLPRPDQGEGPTINNSPVQLENGAMLIFHWIAEYHRSGLAIGKRWRSTDDWQTVTGPEEARFYVPDGVGGGYGDNGLPYSTMWVDRSILELPGGDLIVGCYGWFKGDTTPSEYQKKMNRFRCFLMRSKDQGLNWRYVTTIAADPTVGQEGFNESALVHLKQGKHKGRLICVMRVGRKNPLYQAYSDDEGMNWSKAQPLNVVGVDPDLIETSNGVLVLSFGHKPDYNDDGNFLAFSFDQGESWSQIVRLSSHLTSAYTSVREISPPKLFVVYDLLNRTTERPDRFSPNRRILGRVVELKGVR